MSTANFETQTDFDLYLWDISFKYATDEDNIKGMEELYEMDRDEITDTEKYEFLNRECEFEAQFKFDELDIVVRDLEKELKRDLNFFKIVIKCGHYNGLQLYVENNSSMLEHYELEDLTNYVTKEWEGMCLSEFKRKYNSEMNFINKKLLPKVAQELGFRKYACTAVFSNGEAIYTAC